MPAGSSIEPRPAACLARLQAEWRCKLGLTLALNLFFWAGYGFLSRHPVFPVRTMPVTWLDELVPYAPTYWSAVYLSQFLFTGLVPWLIPHRLGLRRYAVGLFALCGLSFLCFLLWPVASPRPTAIASGPVHAFVLQWDGRYNAFPSLHAGFLVYTGLLARRLFGGALLSIPWLTAAVWAGLILWATLATRQHYVVDLCAGALVGGVADGLAWRASAGARAARITLRRNGAMSQSGSR